MGPLSWARGYLPTEVEIPKRSVGKRGASSLCAAGTRTRPLLRIEPHPLDEGIQLIDVSVLPVSNPHRLGKVHLWGVVPAVNSHDRHAAVAFSDVGVGQ